METEAMVITVVSAIISGVLATAITLYVNYKSEQLKIKRDLVDDIFGYRYQMSSGYVGADKSGLNRALNRIPIVFNGSESVLRAYEELHDAATTISDPITRSQKMDDVLITLYKEMCKAAKIKVDNWNDSRIKKTFTVS